MSKFPSSAGGGMVKKVPFCAPFPVSFSSCASLSWKKRPLPVRRLPLPFAAAAAVALLAAAVAPSLLAAAVALLAAAVASAARRRRDAQAWGGARRGSLRRRQGAA